MRPSSEVVLSILPYLHKHLWLTSVLVASGRSITIHRRWEIIVLQEAVSSCKQAGWALIRREQFFQSSTALDWKEALKLRDFTVCFFLCLENRERLVFCELLGVFWQNQSLCPIFLHTWKQFWRKRQSWWKWQAPHCLQEERGVLFCGGSGLSLCKM